MASSADLYSGDDLDNGSSELPAVMDGTILDVDESGRLSIEVPALDSGDRGRSARGTWPDAQAGDPCWAVTLADGGLLVIGWEASSA